MDNIAEKKCLVCGKRLVGQQRSYCSRKCRRKAQYLKQKTQEVRVQERKVCPNCGKVFYNNRKVYCSHDCMKIASRKEQMDSYRKVRAVTKKIERPNLSWNDVIRGMKETGLQYGEYIARYDNE